ncbi:MAG TPA: hypothetical protein VGV92_00110 [Gammaproteobacteria bacterium]|nr:hypothetical protein [Gammaproteobacteria bacterium]
MFAKHSDEPTEYPTKASKTIKITFIAANKQSNPEVLFEFPDQESAKIFFKDRSDMITEGDLGGLSAGSNKPLFATGCFSLICVSNFSKARLIIKANVSTESLLMHTSMFSMVLDCITEYEKGVIDEFFLNGLNTDKFSNAAMKVNGKDSASLILQDLAKCSDIREVVTKDLKFEISIDINGLDKRSQDYYEKLLALEVEKTRLTKAYEAKEDVAVAKMSSASAEISPAEIAMWKEFAHEKRLGRGFSSGAK